MRRLRGRARRLSPAARLVGARPVGRHKLLAAALAAWVWGRALLAVAWAWAWAWGPVPVARPVAGCLQRRPLGQPRVVACRACLERPGRLEHLALADPAQLPLLLRHPRPQGWLVHQLLPHQPRKTQKSW